MFQFLLPAKSKPKAKSFYKRHFWILTCVALICAAIICGAIVYVIIDANEAQNGGDSKQTFAKMEHKKHKGDAEQFAEEFEDHLQCEELDKETPSERKLRIDLRRATPSPKQVPPADEEKVKELKEKSEVLTKECIALIAMWREERDAKKQGIKMQQVFQAVMELEIVKEQIDETLLSLIVCVFKSDSLNEWADGWKFDKNRKLKRELYPTVLQVSRLLYIKQQNGKLKPEQEKALQRWQQKLKEDKKMLQELINIDEAEVPRGPITD